LSGVAPEQVLDPERARHPAHLLTALGAGNVPHTQREAHVVRHGHVRVERVRLEDECDVAALGAFGVHDPAPYLDLARVRALQPCDQTQGR
jgi:hypothetical protein